MGMNTGKSSAQQGADLTYLLRADGCIHGLSAPCGPAAADRRERFTSPEAVMPRILFCRSDRRYPKDVTAATSEPQWKLRDFPT